VVGFIGFGVLMAAVPLVPARAIAAVFVAKGLLAGLVEISGTVSATFTLGAAMIAACLVALWLFRRVAIST